MEKLIHMVIRLIGSIIAVLPFWGRSVFVRSLAFICYSTTVLIVNFADNLLADHCLSFFVILVLAANLVASPMIRRIGRNLAGNFTRIAKECLKEEAEEPKKQEPETATTATSTKRNIVEIEDEISVEFSTADDADEFMD